MRRAVPTFALLLACGGAPAAAPVTPTAAPMPVSPDSAAEAPLAEPSRPPATRCASAPRVEDCIAAATEALAGGDAAAALAMAHRACRATSPSDCSTTGVAPGPGSREALELLSTLAWACDTGWEPGCVLRPLGTALLGEAEAACADGDCTTLATLYLLGFGVTADVAAAARVSGGARYEVRVAILEAGGVLAPIPLAEPPPSRAAMLVSTTSEDEPPEGEPVGSDGEREYYLVGAPAISADGHVVAALRSDGDANNDERVLVSLELPGGALARSDPLSESHASEEETPEEASQFRETRAAVTRASRYLARRGFRSLVRLSAPDEPALVGVPVLDWTSDGWVTIRDPSTGRVLFRERMVVPDPDAVPPEDLDETARDQWDNDHWCDVPGLEEAMAWRIDETRVLVETRVNPPPDDCFTHTEHTIVSLTPSE